MSMEFVISMTFSFSFSLPENDIMHPVIGPTSTPFVDPLDGCFMGNPPIVELTGRSRAPTKVLVELTSNASHDLLEAGQLVLKVLQSVMENIYLGALLSYHLTKVATLTES